MSTAQTFVSVAELGVLIRQARKVQALRLQDAAGLCGVSMRFLSELENGRESCSMGRVLQVCRTLGIDLLACRRGGEEA